MRPLFVHRFEGEKCQKCDDLICHNSGVCSVASAGLKVCRCSPGFAGKRCEENLCQGYCKSGTCIPAVPPHCQCPPGKTGLRCHLNEAQQMPNQCPDFCHNGATCLPLLATDAAPTCMYAPLYLSLSSAISYTYVSSSLTDLTTLLSCAFFAYLS